MEAGLPPAPGGLGGRLPAGHAGQRPERRQQQGQPARQAAHLLHASLRRQGLGQRHHQGGGRFGMVTVLGVCLAPLLQMAVHYLAYKLVAALSCAFGGGRYTRTAEAPAGR